MTKQSSDERSWLTLGQLDADLPLSDVATMEEVMADSIWQPRLYAMLFAVFAGGALVLAVIGIYGVMAYIVITRTHEIGIRMALGATARDVFRLIVWTWDEVDCNRTLARSRRSICANSLDARSLVQYQRDGSGNLFSDRSAAGSRSFSRLLHSGATCNES